MCLQTLSPVLPCLAYVQIAACTVLTKDINPISSELICFVSTVEAAIWTYAN